jgi:hypothetical protein
MASGVPSSSLSPTSTVSRISSYPVQCTEQRKLDAPPLFFGPMFKRNGAGYTEVAKGIVGTEIGRWSTSGNGSLQGTPELGACVPPVGVLHDSELRLQGMHAGVWNFRFKPKDQWKVRSAKKVELKKRRIEETGTPASLTRSELDRMGAESLLSLSSAWLDTEEEGSEKGQDKGSGEGSQVGKPGVNETPAAGAEFSPPSWTGRRPVLRKPIGENRFHPS